MRHGMNNAEKRIGKGHSSKTLCIVHFISGLLVLVIRIHQIVSNHFNGMQRQRIRVVAICGRNIGLNRMA